MDQETARKIYSGVRIIRTQHATAKLFIDEQYDTAKQLMIDVGLQDEVVVESEVNIYGSGDPRNPVV